MSEGHGFAEPDGRALVEGGGEEVVVRSAEEEHGEDGVGEVSALGVVEQRGAVEEVVEDLELEFVGEGGEWEWF